MFVLSSCLIVTASHPQACWNFGACFLGNRLKGRQHWYELLESYCLLFWVKEAEAPRDIRVPKVTLAVVAEQDQKKPLMYWGASFCLHTDSVVWKQTPCQHILSGASSSLLNSNSSQALLSVPIIPPPPDQNLNMVKANLCVRLYVSLK